MNIQVYIPSYRRPKGVTSIRWFPHGRVVVPESQVDQYAEHMKDGELIGILDSQDGNIARKRNTILEMAEEDWIVLVDDDYEYVGVVENRVQRWLSVGQIEELIRNGCEMAEELGTGLWGLNVQSDPKFYREYAPFSMLSPILGPWMGIKVGTGLRFDESIPLKEDYDFWLQSMERWHRTLRFNKYHYKVNHLNRAGGVVSSRTRQAEIDQVKAFQRKWGSGVVTFDVDKSVNPRVRVPLRGI